MFIEVFVGYGVLDDVFVVVGVVVGKIDNWFFIFFGEVVLVVDFDVEGVYLEVCVDFCGCDFLVRNLNCFVVEVVFGDVDVVFDVFVNE